MAHFLDGLLLKGTTDDFCAGNDTFTLTDWERTVEIVDVNDLKALFFVHSLDGNHDYRERKGFYTMKKMCHKVMVEFFDGEVLFGYTDADYTGGGVGFYMYPGDPKSNNIKIFIVRAAAKRVKVVPNEEFSPTPA